MDVLTHLNVAKEKAENSSNTERLCAEKKNA